MAVGSERLPLTGERTVPGIERENYWFRRHEAVYRWLAESVVAPMRRSADGPREAGPAQPIVMEAGCGEGYGAQLLHDAGARVIAVDYDRAVVEHVARSYPDVEVAQANLVDLPLADHSIDAVVCLQVIEHLWDLRGFYRECRRVLRPGGVIAVSTPNRVTFSPGVGRGEKPTNPFHVEEFDAGQVGAALEASGFIDCRVLGLTHSARLRDHEARNGPIVARQISAVLADGWDEGLLGDVAAITGEDFTIEPWRAALDDEALDLIATACAPLRDGTR